MWVIVGLVSLIILIILVLCIPLDFFFQINISESTSFRFRLRWLFGLIDKDLRKAREKPEKKGKDGQKPRRQINAGTIYQILRTKGLFNNLRHLIINIFRNLSIKELTANIKLGLENPADTAILFAFLGPLYYLLNKLPHDIKVSPSFDGDINLEAYLHGIIRLWPILIVPALLKCIFSLPAMRIFKILVLKR